MVAAYIDNNNTSVYDSKYLNNFVNISNEPPEIIDYYDLDADISSLDRPSASPEIYPDPDKIVISSSSNTIEDTEKNHQKNSDVHSTVNTNFEDFIGQQIRTNEDFKEHDTIDNIMYIYYGSSGAMRKSVGGSVIIFGAVLALAAQILAIILSMLRNR